MSGSEGNEELSVERKEGGIPKRGNRKRNVYGFQTIRPGWLPQRGTAEGPIIDENYWIRTFNLDKSILISHEL